jgi:hypothetical protein
MKTKVIFTFGVFLLVLMAGRAFAGGAMINCSTLYVGCGGYGPCDFENIQDAVDDADAYDTIIVCPNDYGCYDDVLITGDKDGLTIMSQEIPDCGPNTCVDSFTIGFAPHSDHPEHVTIKGFNVTPCKDNGVGIESSTNYNTIAFNHVFGCVEEFAGAGGAIRVNTGNVGNNIHHNLVDDCGGTTSGIYAEKIDDDESADHNIHQNCVEGCKENGIRLGSDYSQVHQNQILDYILRGIFISDGADGNQVHHNEVCDSTDDSIELSGGTTGNFIHHNILTGEVTGSTGGDRIRMNDTNADCPFEELMCCKGAAVDGTED